MVRWTFRCGKTCLGAVVGLAALIALAEVGLRIAAISHPPPASPAAPTPAAVHSWVTGWELRPLQRITVRSEEGEPFVFRTNRWGMRGGDVAAPKPAGVFRIACLGGDKLIASNTPEPHLFAVQLQAALQQGVNYPIEIANAALPLGGPSLALIQFERTIAAMQPDAVLVMIDAQDLLQDIALRKWITRDRQGLPVSCAPLAESRPPSSNMMLRLRQEFRLIDWGCQRLVRELSSDSTTPTSISLPQAELSREQVVQTLLPLKELALRCEARHMRLLIVATPSRGDVMGSDGNASPAALSDRTFLSVLGELLTQTGTVGIDASAVFSQSAGDTSSLWNLDEQRNLATLVAQGIRERLPGPWSSPYFQNGGVSPASHQTPAARAPH